jgi:ubiquinone/menaquinone biosynthesis C-methylase UbiE
MKLSARRSLGRAKRVAKDGDGAARGRARKGVRMTTARELFGRISGGRVLDVATGNGQFVGFLAEGLLDYVEIIGIDTNERAEPVFEEALKDRQGIRFVKMDAEELRFSDASFDTVCLSNLLHHMADLPRVLGEMTRVLRPRGCFIVSEMYRDKQTKTQRTHVLLHDWWGRIDAARGVFRAQTYTREEILGCVRDLDLEDLATHDLCDLSADPKDPETVAQLATGIERYIERAATLPNATELQERGRRLLQRVREVGFHSATTLLAVRRKRAA